MKFTAEEMAYDPSPEETADWVPVARGWKAFMQFREWKRQMARLEPDVRKVFPDDASVNAALRKLIELQDVMRPGRKKRTA